jgi:hypothetical protein
MAKRKAMRCPKRWCWRTAIHANATSFPLLDTDGDLGYHLRVECPKHGWQDKGDGWTSDELIEAGLT